MECDENEMLKSLNRQQQKKTPTFVYITSMKFSLRRSLQKKKKMV